MVASLSGTLALVVGLAVLLLPLLATEMSRPRDAMWGAVVLLLGLTLVTSADRLTGSPMLAVLCGGLLIGRLGVEVLQLRWRALTSEEQQRLLSVERWQTSLSELVVSVAKGIAAVSAASGTVLAALKRGGGSKASSGKRWVRAEASATNLTSAKQAKAEPTPVVGSFAEIDQLLQAAVSQAG
ncbi:MAG: Ycf66 family protein [Vulcanococcus sp.]